MNTRLQPKPPLLYNLFSLPLIAPRPVVQFSPQDLGYEIDEEEIARESLLQEVNCFEVPQTPAVPPEDFEATYGFFLS
jgi:hypothetical protein